MNVIVILTDTFRRDHMGPYNLGRPLNECWSAEAPPWKVPTPNIDRLGERGVVFDNCWCGSTPCMPARRDVYTGQYEFLWKGWGPLKEDDKDLPRQVSGPPNHSVKWSLEQGYKVSYLATDHFHLWEQGSGNYHMGYTGFDFIRGIESDAWYTDPIEFACPESSRMGKTERHYRNVHHVRQTEDDWFAAKTFGRAAEWLERNHEHEDFYLHIDVFSPHEPWDPPEDLLKLFDPKGYDVPGCGAGAPYAPWREHLTEEQFNSYRARYAANAVLVDRSMGKLFEAMDRLDLWSDTMVILTTDHGTFNGDHGRTGKLQTHEFDAVGHIPFIVACPGVEGGQRREQLVQLVDIYPTVLNAVGRPVPEGRHGVDLMPVLANASAATREVALAGQFGKSVTMTDGTWTLHQSPVEGNQPLYWYGYDLAKFMHYDLGGVQDNCRRHVRNCASWPEPTWLSYRPDDPNELNNLAEKKPEQLLTMQRRLKQRLVELKAPPEQIERLGLEEV